MSETEKDLIKKFDRCLEFIKKKECIQMNYKKTCNLIDGIIENEFKHTQEFREVKFIDNDLEQIQLMKTSEELMDKLNETLSEEQKDLLDEVASALADTWINTCRFYFKQGVTTGLTDLKFINNIDMVEMYIR